MATFFQSNTGTDSVTTNMIGQYNTPVYLSGITISGTTKYTFNASPGIFYLEPNFTFTNSSSVPQTFTQIGLVRGSASLASSGTVNINNLWTNQASGTNSPSVTLSGNGPYVFNQGNGGFNAFPVSSTANMIFNANTLLGNSFTQLSGTIAFTQPNGQAVSQGPIVLGASAAVSMSLSGSSGSLLSNLLVAANGSTFDYGGAAMQLNLAGLSPLTDASNVGATVPLTIGGGLLGNFGSFTSTGTGVYSGLTWSLTGSNTWLSSVYAPPAPGYSGGMQLEFIPNSGAGFGGVVVVPEPAQMSLVAGLGAAAFGAWRLRKRSTGRRGDAVAC
jgi:hypothetical protein